jgi:mono/diheme cytochrome c family protein
MKHKSAESVGNCDPTKTYFTKDVLLLLNSKCGMSGCHVGSFPAAGYNFTNYYGSLSGVSIGNPLQSKLYTSVLSSTSRKRMPPKEYPALDSAQIAIIYNWILQGAKNQICTDNSVCDTTLVLFNTTVSTIMNNNCTGCHSTSSAAGGVDLSTYSGITTQASNGKLMNTINFTSGYRQMPPSGEQLSNCDRMKIQKWIDNGKKNN